MRIREIIIATSAVLLLAGCWSTPKISMLSDADSWQIPVVPAKMETAPHLTSPPDGRGIVQDEPEMVITVPPSDKPTKIEVRKVKRSVIEKVLTNKPAHEVKSDNQGVVANQPKKVVWWRWVAAGIIGLLFVAAIVAAIASRVANFSPWGMVLKLFKRG